MSPWVYTRCPYEQRQPYMEGRNALHIHIHIHIHNTHAYIHNIYYI